ncbi:MAG: Ig-like domain-containing protein, partial [Lachnospiraceae bacterium]|nr:Ig-like domain-containing protein [Lachnospiraceae bacterium]
MDNPDLTTDPDEGDVSLVGADVIRPPVEDDDPLTETDPDPDEQAVDNRPYEVGDPYDEEDGSETGDAGPFPETNLEETSETNLEYIEALQFAPSVPAPNTTKFPVPVIATIDDPEANGWIKITDRIGLEAMSGSNKYYLANEIDLTGTPWTPINGFTGTLDGQGYVIRGLAVSGSQQYAGLFGNLGTGTIGGTIRNVGLEGTAITVSYTGTGNACAGGIAGYACATASIYNCYNEVAVNVSSASGVPYAGGIVGYAAASSVAISNCRNDGAVTSTSTASVSASDTYICAGGIVGYDGTVSHCVNTGNVSSLSNAADSSNRTYICAGGMLGYAKTSVSNCRNEGAVSATSTTNNTNTYNYICAGGIYGYVDANLSIADCENGGAVTAASTATVESSLTTVYAGGVVGRIKSFLTVSVTGCHNGAVVKALGGNKRASAGGVIGYNDGNGTASITGSGNGGKVSAESSNSSYAGGIYGNSFGNDDTVTDCQNSGEVSTADTSTGGAAGGIFGYSNSNNLTMSGCRNTGMVSAGNHASVYAGGICGSSNDTTVIEDCHNEETASVTGGTAAGIIGFVRSGAISDCTNAGAVGDSGSNNAGGICSSTAENTTISDCRNTGSVSASSYAGGICAEMSGSITGCVNEGDVSVARNYAGGICANAAYGSGNIENCSNTGVVSSTNGAMVGGICGYAGGIVIDSCYNTGPVSMMGDTSSFAHAAGICGRAPSAATIRNSYNTGRISSSAYAGGICGEARGSGASTLATIENCYNTGYVSGSNAGGVCGVAGYITISKSYNLGAASGRYVGGICGRVGYTTTISDSYNRGDMDAAATGSTSSACAGGIIGATDNNSSDNTTIDKCYNTGDLGASADSNAYVGGICGNVGSSGAAALTNSYWNIDSKQTVKGNDLAVADKRRVSGEASAIGALTDANMKQQSSYDGFTFPTVWTIKAGVNEGYPILAQLDDPPAKPAKPATPPTTEKTIVSVVHKSGSLTAGTASEVEYTVTTANITNSTYPASVANLPAGVTVKGGTVTIGSDGKGTLTLAGDATTIAGTHSNLALTLTVDGAGVVSGHFALTIALRNNPVTGITLNRTALALEVGESATLRADVEPTGATDSSLVWTISEGGDAFVDVTPNGHAATVTATAAGTTTITATNAASGVSSAPCMVTVVPAVLYPEALSLSPSYTTAAAGTEGLTIALATTPAGRDNDLSGLAWEYQGPGAAWSKTPPAGLTNVSATETGVTVNIAATAAPGTYRIRATAPGARRGGQTVQLTATAAIAVVAAGSEGSPAEARLLGGNASGVVSVTANPARSDGVAVPFEVTKASAALLEIINNKDNIGKPGIVSLYTGWDSEAMTGTPLTGGLSAALTGPGAIEIIAAEVAVKAGGVTAVIGSGENRTILAGTLNIAVKTSYPKLTFATDSVPNAFYPGSTATVTATADNGARVTAVALGAPIGKAGDSLTASGATVTVTDTGKAKAGNHKFAATVTVEGYKKPIDTTATVRVINERPKLKLQTSTVTLGKNGLYEYGDASFRIVSSEAAKPLGGYWGGLDEEKSKVFPANSTTASEAFKVASDGTVTILAGKQAEVAAGKYRVSAVFKGGSAPINLNLTVKWADYANKKASFKLSPATVTVNRERSQQGDVVVAIVPSAANLVYRDWVAEGLPDGFTAYESG